MSELNPSFALQGDDGLSWSLQTERLSLHAVDDIRKLRLQVLPRGGINPAPLERLLGNTLPQSPQEKVSNMPTAYWLGPNDWVAARSCAGDRPHCKHITGIGQWCHVLRH